MKPGFGIQRQKPLPAALKLHGRRRMCLSVPANCVKTYGRYSTSMPGFLGRRKTLKETLQDDNQAIERLRQRVAPFAPSIKERSGHGIAAEDRNCLACENEEDQEQFYKDVLEQAPSVMDLLDSKGLERSRVSIRRLSPACVSTCHLPGRW